MRGRSNPPVGEYRHTKESRKNNPAVGLAKNDNVHGSAKYSAEIDPHDSPILLFSGREASDSIEVETVQLHTHESIHPSVILKPVTTKKPTMDDFFGDPRPHNEAVEFYEHEDGWTNRLIAGDSLLVMNSLLQLESMAGRVQMIYFDPPYGIRYDSNFQPRIFNTDVKNNVENVEMRPEPIKAFRDTWKLEIHSYLAMVRKRLMLAKDLLADGGSIFMQISTENQHLVRVLLDEVFGRENFMWQMLFRTKGGGGSGPQTEPIRLHNLVCQEQRECKVQPTVEGQDRRVHKASVQTASAKGRRHNRSSERRAASKGFAPLQTVSTSLTARINN